jgi:hypothetical protein
MCLSLSLVVPMVALLVDITITGHLLWILFLVFGFVYAYWAKKAGVWGRVKGLYSRALDSRLRGNDGDTRRTG